MESLSRHVVKTLIHFARREYKEKHPKAVRVYRVKKETALTRGVLPTLKMTQIGHVKFLVIADYGNILRIYSYNRQGIMLSGENIDFDSKIIKEIEKSTKTEYHFPKM